MPVVGAVVAVDALGAFHDFGAESDGAAAQSEQAVDVGADLLGVGALTGMWHYRLSSDSWPAFIGPLATSGLRLG